MFDRMTAEELPPDLVPELRGQEFLYFFTEYGYTLFLLSTKSGTSPKQAKGCYALLYEFTADIKERYMRVVDQIFEDKGVVLIPK